MSTNRVVWRDYREGFSLADELISVFSNYLVRKALSARTVAERRESSADPVTIGNLCIVKNEPTTAIQRRL